MYTETEPIKGSSSSSSQSAPPQNGYNFNYPPQTHPTMGIPVPMNASSHHQFPTPWSTGLCDCLDDPGTCCLTFWCPCVTFARIAEITDKGSVSCGLSGMLYATILLLTGMSFCYSCFYRSKLRGQFFLEESPCSDCCVHLCCEECALCQEYRELKNRGFDMTIRWNGNVERQIHGTMPPLPPMGLREVEDDNDWCGVTGHLNSPEGIMAAGVRPQTRLTHAYSNCTMANWPFDLNGGCQQTRLSDVVVSLHSEFPPFNSLRLKCNKPLIKKKISKNPVKGSDSVPPQDGGNFDYSQQSQPTMGVPVMHDFSHQQPLNPWSTGLYDCFDDPANCCFTFWCPCVTFGQIAEITDKGTRSCGTSGTLYTVILLLSGCAFLCSCCYRSKLRNQYFLEQSPCPDCCVHFWCEGCALCQEYRELKNHGFDMSIGWHGNMERLEKQMGGVPVALPMVQQPMQR